MKKYIKKYAAHLGAAAVVITAVASAAVTPLPGTLPASVANGDIIEASHINDILSSLNILDQRTDGDAPVDDVDIVNKGYLDGEVATLNTAISNAGDNLGDHTATQDLDAAGNAITNVSTPVNNTDAVNKDYVDGAVAAASGGSGDGFGQNVRFTTTPYTGNLDGVTGGDTKCAAEYPGYRMAHSNDLWGNSYSGGRKEGWIQHFRTVGNDLSDTNPNHPSLDCGEWTRSGTTNQGPTIGWDDSTSQWGVSGPVDCSVLRSITCMPL